MKSVQHISAALFLAVLCLASAHGQPTNLRQECLVNYPGLANPEDLPWGTDRTIYGAAYADLSRRLDGARANYLYPDGEVAEQIGIPRGIPDWVPSRRLSDQVIGFTGCRQHSCDEKSFILASTEGDALAAGLISFSPMSSLDYPFSGYRLSIWIFRDNSTCPHFARLITRPIHYT